MKERAFLLLSVPNDFVEKFNGFINNINMLNDSPRDPLVKVESVFLKKKPEFAVVPKGLKKKEGE